MIKENENVSIASKRNCTKGEINAVYKKGENEGRIEGVLAYQKGLIENLQRDNASLSQKLQETKK